jgi:heptosyltransferase-2
MTEHPEHILLMRFSSVGDIVLATPVAARLRRRYPQARITWLTDDGYLDLVRDNPDINQAVAYEYTGRHRGPGGIRRLARELSPVDFVVDLQHKVRSVLLTATLRPARRKVLIKRRGFGLVRVLVGRDVILGAPHQVDRYLAVLGEDGQDGARDEPVLRIDGRNREEALRLLPDAAGAPRVGVFPGSRHHIKRWPVRHMATLSDLLGREGVQVVLLGGHDEAGLVSSVVESTGAKKPYAHTGSSLGLLAGLVSFCDVLVSSDSGPAHMASALGVPTVTLFGPTSPERWAPRGPGTTRVLRHALPCSPCSNHGGSTCPVGTLECMQGLMPDAVFDEVRKVLTAKGG